MTYIESIILGVLQGITEFLPISSTGHLVLARELFGIAEDSGLAFDAILHLATVVAVLAYFHKDIFRLFQAVMRKLGKLPVNDDDLTLVYALLVGTIPAGVLGFFLEDVMESTLRDPLIVAAVLVAGSLLFIYAEWVYLNNYRTNDMNIKKGFKIGWFQALALLPGMSRSGATLSGGMILGLSREEAARFAFLLAIPVLSGAGLKKMIDLIQSPDVVNWGIVLLGAGVAFVTGMAAIHFMLAFVRKHSLWPFIWYRFILAGLVVFVVAFG